MAKKAEEKHNPDRYRLVARPAVKGKHIGAVVKESDPENTPIFACGHKHDYAPEAIACIRRSITRLYPNFDIVN